MFSITSTSNMENGSTANALNIWNARCAILQATFWKLFYYRGTL